MTIRDRIFDKLQEMKMTQKEFAKRTGIAESTISDWRKKNTNPSEWYAIDALTESGQLIKAFNSMDKAQQSRLLGYAEALTKKE